MKFQFRYSLLLLVVTLMVWGCKKEDNDIYVAPSTTSLKVYNATDYVFNVYQNGTRLTTSANISTGSASSYLSVSTGMQRFAFKVPYNVLSTDSLIARNDTVFSTTLVLDSGKRYSLFAVGNATQSSAFKVIDTTQTVSAGQLNIRFVHAAPNAGPLRMTLNDNIFQFDNTKYQSVHSLTVSTSVTQMVVKLYKGNSTTPAFTSQTIDFVIGNSYTIFARDLTSNGVAIGRKEN